MSSTVQVSLDSNRENQISKIQELHPELPRGLTDCVKKILFDQMDAMSKEKAKEKKG